MATTAATDMVTAVRAHRRDNRRVGPSGLVQSRGATIVLSLGFAAFRISLIGLGVSSHVLAQPVSQESATQETSADTRVPERAADADLRRLAGSAVRLPDMPEQAPARRLRIEPRVALRESWTDNIDLKNRDAQQSEWVSELKPGISIVANGARLKGELDYALTGLFHTRDSQRNDHQNALNAFGQLEVVERFFFVEARAQISQQFVSAFGARPASNTSDTQNRTETRVFSLTPYIKGRIASAAAYDLRFDEARSRANDSRVSDSNIRTWTGKIESTDLARFGWSVDFKDQRYDVKEGLDTETRLARGTLIYHVDRSLRIFVRGGRESNNYYGGDRSRAIHGAGVEWNPSERTQFSAENDKRFFGRGYRYSARHRTSLSAWNLAISKESTNTVDQLRRGSESTPFQRLFHLLATEIPDPERRAEQARQSLLAAGISPDATSENALLANQVFVDKRIEGSVVLLGGRSTIALSAFRSERRPVSQLALSGDDFALASLLKENGAAMNWSRTLSPLSSLATGVVWSRVTGSGSSTSPETTQLGFNVQLNKKFSPRTGGALGYRHVKFRSDGGATDDYRENAVFASIDHRF